MSKLINGAIAGTVLGAVAGIAIGVDKALRQIHKEDTEQFEKMLQTQCVFDTFDPQLAMTWFEEKQESFSQETVFFVGKITDPFVVYFDLGKIPDDVDVSHMLIQGLIDKTQNKALACRLISYCKLTPFLESKFEETDFIIITSSGHVEE